MAGLYIHIPFCKQACSYCNFHFSTNFGLKEEVIDSICKEIAQRSGYVGSSSLKSVYFGGGTPSLLSLDEMQKIWSAISRSFDIADDAEVTLEANPDDLLPEKISELWASPVNRLSIGVQAFFDTELKLMNRTHTADEAIGSIERCMSAGFHNLNIDLIYGTPGLSHDQWIASLAKVAAADVPHLSAYQLTIEPRTILAHLVKKGKFTPADDEKVAHQFQLLSEWAGKNGYEHYEISNICKPGMRAVHNSSYWNAEAYLGVGPSAHSYNGLEREWNIANNALYTRMMATEGSAVQETETLSIADRYNELLMTSMRLSEGLDVSKLDVLDTGLFEYFKEQAEPYVSNGLLEIKGVNYVPTARGRLLSDRIASDCFLLEG